MTARWRRRCATRSCTKSAITSASRSMICTTCRSDDRSTVAVTINCYDSFAIAMSAQTRPNLRATPRLQVVLLLMIAWEGLLLASELSFGSALFDIDGDQ